MFFFLKWVILFSTQLSSLCFLYSYNIVIYRLNKSLAIGLSCYDSVEYQAVHTVKKNKKIFCNPSPTHHKKWCAHAAVQWHLQIKV